jgi:pilus assembly protein CpaB
VTRAPRRRRALLLLGLALACGGLAASQVRQRERALEERVGPLVPAVVATRELPLGARLSRKRIGEALRVRSVPAHFAPPDALSSPDEALGLRTAAAVAAGGYLTAGSLETGERAEHAGPLLRRGERAVEVSVAGGQGLAEYAGPGARVDVLVTSGRESGGGRSFVALESVELLGIRPGDASAGGAAAGGDGAGAASLATLRVSVRQAVYLTAAHNFAREIRLLARSPGDDRPAAAFSVDARGL